ncbi:ParB N-terminal domain-containing protein [Bradyrhizobium sp. LjRoot220]|uniref:ParB/RepB/Spo0J family partition protein n=1 Tax=Bradyrhizobium sp. LjRoot220 TaxID=3342284 RepID=UPI003ECC8F5B
MQPQIQVPLSQLKIDPANVRKDSDLKPSFLASISEKGVIQPLTVRKNGDGYLVTDGGKRLAALQAISKRGKNGGDPMVAVVVRDDTDIEAADTSLTTNYIRDDMHPADEYEAFATLKAGGMSREDIRKRYGLSNKEVDQVLELGALSPNVRLAWKEDRLREDAAQAFTLEPDHARQDAILKKLGKWPNRYQVRTAILGEDREHGKLMVFVTPKAYEDAGGKIIKDLFAQNHEAASHVSDPALLMRLAEDKVKAERDKLLADGWSFAEYDVSNQRYQLDRLDRGSYKPKAVDKARSGCLLHLNHDGELVTEKWFVKTKEATSAAKAKTTKADAATTKSPTTLSNALKQRLNAQLLKATQQALLEDTKDSGLDEALAKIVAAQITPDRAGYMPRQVTDGLAAVRANLTPKIILAAVVKNFDAKNYFSGAPKNIVIAAIKEAAFNDTQFKPAGKTKADIWKFAVANVTKTGWLPKELRGPYYTGPAKAVAAPAKAAKKGKK